MELVKLLAVARKASAHASREILEIYESEDFGVDMKSDDSPLTKVDKKAHEVICGYLESTGFPVLSEEGSHLPYEVRQKWDVLWIVDPLDGTKEFIKKNGEFTVNIALVKNGEPILGVVEAPVLDIQYFGIKDKGAWVCKDNGEIKLEALIELNLEKSKLRVVASRSHLTTETQQFLDELNEPEIVSMGSSLKFMMIAEKQADIYPRFAPTMEWDTAAAQAIINSLGGNVVDHENKPLIYNKENLLNPFFKVY